METAAAIRSPLYLFRACEVGSRRPDLVRFDGKSHFFSRSIKGFGSISVLKRGKRPFGPRRSYAIRASSSSSSGSSSPIAPLRLESPVGQFLSQILVSHPHLLPAAVEQQLEQLHTDREAEKIKEEPTPSGSELVLYRRIAEVKANERRRALEEILYALVVQKFVEADVTLVPSLAGSADPSGRIDQWPPEEEKLEGLHSPEAYEMIKNHLSLILGQRLADSNTVAPISKLRVGQVYAASVMYGYFLKRVDQRFQLEKSMKSLPWGSEEEESAIKQVMPDESRPRPSPQMGETHPEVSWSSPSFGAGGPSQAIKPSRLRSYVMSFDSETLQRYATIRSKEAFGIIEKHTEALFGRPEIVITPEGTIDSSKDELIKISFAGLRRLILEAVTFGSFLWDVESYVDARYHFVTN
ncbi:UV-B-induced protein At3g17800, chloroplastic-like [Typha angustifolia]|uniref:UV-B-induced protein At3g17800, chloroplastic-like n=1 Tax=Typha angustifolia TaxID=59011 RepID=UPI003C2CC2A4